MEGKSWDTKITGLFTSNPRLERRLMKKLSGNTPRPDDWDKAKETLSRTRSWTSSREDVERSSQRITSTTRYLAEQIPIDTVNEVLRRCRSARHLEKVAKKVGKTRMKLEHEASGYEIEDLESLAVMLSSGKRRGMGAKLADAADTPRIKKPAAGIALTLAAAVLAVTVIRVSDRGEKGYTPDTIHSIQEYAEKSPKTYARVKKYFPDEKECRAAMWWLDHADEEGYDNKVTKYFSRYQLADLRRNVITPGYNLAEAMKYNRNYDDEIMAAHTAMQAMKNESPQISFEKAVEKLAGRDMIFINEAHTTPEHIKNEIRLIRGLASSGRPIRVGMELFDKYFNHELNQFLTKKQVGGNYIKQRLQAEMTPAGAHVFSQYFDIYRPLLDEMKKLSSSGVDIELFGLERGYTEQQIYWGFDFYGRDRGMASQINKRMGREGEKGVKPMYVTITGEGHGGYRGHLGRWIDSRLMENSAVVVFGDQPMSIRMEEFLTKVSKVEKPEDLVDTIRKSNAIYMQMGQGDETVCHDLSRQK